MLFKTFIKTTLQSIAAVIPIVTPIIILLLFINFILHKFRFVEPSIPYFSTKEHSYIREPDRFTALSNLSSFRFLSMIGTSISANTAASSTGKPIQW